ncbi:hypothetical protein ACIQI8_34290 [Streptomyces sp. NPDC092369]|uniref:hypothetical protein n=1 Tax=Streptomyces sp. NPDC092369 TaxID=3366015 RepID=UPI0037F81377
MTHSSVPSTAPSDPQSWVRGPTASDAGGMPTRTPARTRAQAPVRTPVQESQIQESPIQETPFQETPVRRPAGQPGSRQPLAPHAPAETTMVLSGLVERVPETPLPRPAVDTAVPGSEAPRSDVPAARRAVTPSVGLGPRAGGVRRKAAPAPAAEASWSAQQQGPARPRSAQEIGWVKAHGGAGTTSLAHALGGVDIGARWPDPARGEPRRILLVGRTSAGGLRSVSRALQALHEGNAPRGLDLLGVILVADIPGRLPLSLLRRIRVIRAAAPVHRVPWIPSWRVGARSRSLPRQLAPLAELIDRHRAEEGGHA